MWHSIEFYADRIFTFLLLGKPAQEMVPIYLGVIFVTVVLLMLRMFRGETK